jgi:hypothetical protein
MYSRTIDARLVNSKSDDLEEEEEEEEKGK